ncbi:ComEA family DNA-binding protein [Chitinilyticum litopenaei]|uniref:ComEA family DNA-binding protein n=1 Tax=Chitinilyticum litopenaei TaxID=1121276 RepID=UPI000424F76D|nr:ComEA family DNA-binding protein [Chitinilyticum litopenaei]
MLKKLLVALFAGLAFCASALAAVDLNTASQQQLEALNGIGPEKAKAIIEYRSKNGPFKTTEDVMKVPGIKEGTYAKIKAEVTVGGKAAAAPATKATPAPKASAPAKK